MRYVKIIPFLVAFVLFSECKKPEEEIDPYPNTFFYPGKKSKNFEGDTVRFNFNVTAPFELRGLRTYVQIGGGAETPLDTVKLSGSDFTYLVEYVIPELAAGTVINLRFDVEDIEGNKSSATYKITLLGLVNYTGIRLDYPIDSSAQAFYSIDKNVTYSFDSANVNQSDVDLFYSYDSAATRFGGLYALNDTVPDYKFKAVDFWVYRNQTKLRNSSMSIASFDGLTSSDVSFLVSHADSSNASSVDSLAIGDVITFKTDQDRMGVLKVTNIIHTMQSSGYVEWDMWIQEDN